MSLYRINPLSRHRLFATTNALEACTRVGALVCPHALHIHGDPSRLDLAWHRARLPQVEFHYFHYGVESRIETDVGQAFLMEVTLQGCGLTRHGDTVVDARPGRAAVVAPRRRLRAEFSRDCAKLLVAIPECALRDVLRGLIGRDGLDPLRFSADIDLDGGAGASLRRTLEFILAEIDAGSSPHVALRAGDFERMLLWTLLVAHENNYSELIAAGLHRREPAWLSMAQQHLESCVDAPLTPAALAAHCGVSVRTLQDGFRRHRGTTPIAMLRELRLRRAHAELSAARAQATTVAAIATACGFDEIGRFAVAYRRRYGESPSTTLRRPPP